jgi:DNA-binding NarL/FixJ family response regulator
LRVRLLCDPALVSKVLAVFVRAVFAYHRRRARAGGVPTSQEVAGLAARGCTNVEISAHLQVSENTVKKHLREVFERLHISSRTELALRFSRLAAVDLVPPGVTYAGDCRITRLARTLPR